MLVKENSNVLKFFKYVYGVDLSDVVVDFTYNLESNSNGYYSINEKNIVHVRKGLAWYETETVMVHELNHLVQAQYCARGLAKFFSMNITHLPQYAWEDYATRRAEIDSRMISVFYLLYAYRDLADLTISGFRHTIFKGNLNKYREPIDMIDDRFNGFKMELYELYIDLLEESYKIMA